MWIFSRDIGQWKRRAPHNFAWETDLYTVEDSSGNRDDSIEKLLSVHEGRFAAAMCVDLRTAPLSKQQRADVAYFIALLMVRVPIFFKRFVPALFESDEALRLLWERVPRFRESLSKMFKAADSKDVTDTFRNLPANEKKALVLALLLSSADSVAEKMYGMRWSYLFTTPDKPFITSETPVVLMRRDRLKLPINGAQLDDPNVEVTFPLSSTITLGLLHGAAGQAAGAVDEAGAADLNRRVLERSEEYILCSSPSFPGDVDLSAWVSRPIPALLDRLTRLSD